MREILVSTGSFQHSLSLVNATGSAGGDHNRVKIPTFGAANAAVPVEQSWV